MEYLNKLIEQYKSATGTTNVDVHSESFIKEFTEWIKSRQLIGKKYLDFIEYMGSHPSLDSSSVEVGKGIFDSVVLDTQMPVVTKYFESMAQKKDYSKILRGEFKVVGGTPKIITGNKMLQSLLPYDFSRFITQNPYDQSCIEGWQDLHNSGENITVGIYGDASDKDIKTKLSLLRTLRDSLYDYYQEEYIKDGDMYYAAVSTTRKMLYRTRCR